MYDGFVARDMDGDGDVDFMTTRGNSGTFDGVIWLEQVRTEDPQAAFQPAHDNDSRALPLPPGNWADMYETDVTYVAPNKAARD